MRSSIFSFAPKYLHSLYAQFLRFSSIFIAILANAIQTTATKTTMAGFSLTSLVLSGMNVAQAADQQAFEKLEKIKLTMALLGYSCRNGVSGGYLKQGETYTVYNTLVKGNRYKLVAAGNVHVKDIDIVLHDENHSKRFF